MLFDQDGMRKAIGGMQGFVRAADSGSVRVNEELGESVKARIADMRRRLGDQMHKVQIMSRPTPLGTSAIALAVGEKNGMMGEGDADSARTVLETLATMLDSLEEGVLKSMANYQQTEANNVAITKKAGP